MLIPSVRVNKVHNSKGSPSLPMANLIAWWSFFLCFVQNTKLSQHTAAKMPCLWLKTVVPAGGPGDDLRAFLSNGPLRARTEAAQQRERERARGQGSRPARPARPAGPAGARLPRAGRIPEAAAGAGSPTSSSWLQPGKWYLEGPRCSF